MRVILSCGLVLFATLSLVPPASAEFEGWYPDRVGLQLGHNRLVMEVRQFLAAADAEAFRHELDAQGNNNGAVSTGEVEAYQRAGTYEFESSNTLCMSAFDLVRIEGHQPRQLELARTTVLGAEGPIDSTKDLYETVTFEFVYAKASTSSPKATVAFARYEDSLNAVDCALKLLRGPDAEESIVTWSGDASESLDLDLPRSAGAASDSPAPASQPASGAAGSTSAVRPQRAILSLAPISGYSIDKSSVRPAQALLLWNGRGLVADTAEEHAFLLQNTVEASIRGGPSLWGAWVQGAAVVGAVGTGGMLLGTVAIAATEVGRYKALKLLAAVPLFSRFEKDEVLDHNRREQLYQYIKNNPGPSFSDLRRILELSNGTLVHHLRILESQEFVKPVRDGFRTRFYVRGPRIVPTTYLTRTQHTILDAIQSNPGVTQKQLSQILGLPRESLFYHTRKLETVGKLRVAKDGKWRRYFPNAEAAPTPPGALPTPDAGLTP